MKMMMILEPKSVYEPALSPLEKLEPKGVGRPEIVSEWDPVVVLVPRTLSELELVLGMMLESMTGSETKRVPGGSLFLMNVSEMETNCQEGMLKLEPTSVSVLKQGLE